MGSERNDKEMMVTQVSVGGFGNEVNAKMLLDYLEEKAGQIWRCRLKRSSIPLGACPEFGSDIDQVQSVNNYEKIETHAFVHFVNPDSVNSAIEAAGKHELVLNNILKVSLGPENPYRMNQRRRKTMPFNLSNVVLEIGLMTNRNNFFVGWRGPDSGVDFLIDPFDRSCKFLFTKDTAFSFKGTKNHAVIKCNYKVEFLVRDVNDIKEYMDYSESFLVFQLASSPLISYRTADDDINKMYPIEILDDDDPWIRTTDFTPSGAIGRCNTYRIMTRIRDGSKVKQALEFLKEQRVHIEHSKTRLKVANEPEFGFLISDPFFSIHYKQDISFKVMFLVNSVLNRCIINQHQFTEKVFDLLRNQPEEVNVAALKHICSYRHPLYDGFTRLKLVQEWLLNNPKLMEKQLEQNDVIEVRRLIITPTKAYSLPPEVELSNRVLRHYKEVSDRFLRVTFMDEGMRTLNNNALNFYPASIVKNPTFAAQKTTIFMRIKSILSEGFHLSGRKYCFLAFSANQLRDRSVWFFSENGKISCNDIISWMGRFSNRNVAKCAARMGQCFSSTYATVDVPRHEVDMELEDVERNGYIFSDGIGKISPELALEVAEKLQLKDNQPCAYQIRYAGCKGVVACWPDKKSENIKLSLRPSMNKFDSDHTVLEICSWTRLQPGFLNRQIITLLSALDVKDEIFWDMQMKMVKKLNLMLENTDMAFDGQCFIQVSNPSVENCFAKHGSRFSDTNKNLTVIEGDVVIAKNSCPHPGDVRVLKAVNVPGLENMFDCLIFPQKGDRPHTDEASGSDLDGDLYFVTWDEKLIPPSKQSWTPMEYTAAEVKNQSRDVRTSDIIGFFIKNMGNDSLGTICNAHVVHADLSDYGALDENCLKLAELAATAVDFPKTGKMVTMPPQLRPKLYPDFMGKEDFQITPSPELQILPSHVPYDKDLEILDSASFLNDAWGCKLSYDRQLNGLLGQYKVSREEEIVTGHIWKVFDHLGAEFDQISEEDRNLIYEKKASAWYQVTYHPIWVKKSLELQEPDRGCETVNLSFAWIAADYLARIKIRCRGIGAGNSREPIHTFGRYIADRI
ncbi:hypothetical protein E3N88_17838 [Mikania micrantha]|uniref:RNA-dependent RNA polymerase n=1 Tax=Mikania micrantha TaxID=192012 RepID=A0A5N6NSY8_9ASTR|nr:hypothetical protein E3N88_17838 [Mikania micrantha]